MQKKHLMVLLFLIPMIVSCGIKYNVRGQVIDAKTGDPVEGAIVAIEWHGYDLLPRLTGLASGYNHLGKAEALSDSDGYFDIPKYAFKIHYLAAYKKGYVCWYSESIFLEERLKNIRGKYKPENLPRKDHDLEEGFIIQLEPFTEEYDKDRHACYASAVASGLRVSSVKESLFRKATEEETELCIKNSRENARRK